MVIFLGLIMSEFINQHNLFLSNYIHNLFPTLSQIETFLREMLEIDIFWISAKGSAVLQSAKASTYRVEETEAAFQRCSVKKFTKFTGKHLCQSFFFLAQVFSSEFCKISKNILFHRTPLVAASKERNYIRDNCKKLHSSHVILFFKFSAYKVRER